MQIIEIILLVIIIVILVLRQKPKVAKKSLSRKLILDSCAVIDGRIIELASSGFIPDTLIVPQFIINELQMLADGSDSHKRERARFGLDVIKELQGSRNCEVLIDESYISEKRPTDDKLVDLSKKLDCPLYTTDYNLGKVADIAGVKVLNVNELAQQLRPSALPGEVHEVKILQKGSNQNQGVGYLDDGTMVVVDGAARLIGKVVKVEVSRTFQTVAGKMIFGQLIDRPRTRSK
jgi:uncharacterized protein YacL